MPPVIDQEKCENMPACIGECFEACQAEAFFSSDDGPQIDSEVCINCGACIDACPVGAITLE